MKRVIYTIIGDLLLLGVLLLAFAFIHHGFSWLKIKYANHYEPTQIVAEAVQETENVIASSDMEQSEEDIKENQEEPAAIEDPEPEEIDTRTEWQKKFADHFTDEVVQTDNSYTSPNVSITISTVTTPDEEIQQGKRKVVYYVADIYVASIDCFRTWLANNEYKIYNTQNILDMDNDSDALIAINGDFYSYQYSGLMVRNGIVYRSDYTSYDICVLYKDGTMETLGNGEYNKDELLNSGNVWQLWNFGPELLTEDGEIPQQFNIGETVSYINPRSAVGYYEPGHYCFVVVDGRQSDWSAGMTLPELSTAFYNLGCKAAYNLDGGGSAVMTFNDAKYSMQSNGGNRDLGDILLIGEPDASLQDFDNGGEQ